MPRRRKARALRDKFSRFFGEPAATAEPSESALHDPALGQRLEARGLAALDDLQPPATCSGHRGRCRPALIGAIGKDDLDERKQPSRRAQERNRSIPVLNIGRMDHGHQKKGQCVDKNVPLLTLDFLARVVTARINVRPPFSALFTLWLSRIAAVRLASRPSCSRT